MGDAVDDQGIKAANPALNHSVKHPPRRNRERVVVVVSSNEVLNRGERNVGHLT